MLHRIAAQRPDVVVVERNIDVDAEYRLATDYHLIATPAFVIDRREVLYGVPEPAKLAARLDGGAPVLA